MKKLSVIFVMVMCLMLSAQSLSYSAAVDSRADALNSLGLFAGTESGYELERAATRTEGLIMLIRLIGAEDEAKEHSINHGFTDVPDWAGAYVSYGVEKGLTNGVGDGRFGAQDTITADQYGTLVLRALGYNDFVWSEAVKKLYSLNIITAAQLSKWKGNSFYRCDMVDLSYDALCAATESGKTLAEKLEADGVFSEEQAKDAGVYHGASLLPHSDESDSLLPGMGNTAANLADAVTTGSLYTAGQVVYDDTYAYFVHYDSVYKVHLIEGAAEKLASLSDSIANIDKAYLGNLNLYGGKLYFTARLYYTERPSNAYEDGNGIWSISLDTGECEKVSGLLAKNMLIRDGIFYYTDLELIYINDIPEGGTINIGEDAYYENRLCALSPESGDSNVLYRWRELLWNNENYHVNRMGISIDNDSLYLCEQNINIENTMDLVGISLSDNSRQVAVAAESTSGDGAYAPMPGNDISQASLPVSDGGWIYYVEDGQSRVLYENGSRTMYPNDICGVWRVRPDGSGREQLFNNVTSTNSGDWTFMPNSMDKKFESYTVRNNDVYVNRSGSGEAFSEYGNNTPPALLRITDGGVQTIYTGAAPTENSYESIDNIATAPGWIFFTLYQNMPISGEDGYIYTKSVSAVYRVRPDGSEPERLTENL